LFFKKTREEFGVISSLTNFKEKVKETTHGRKKGWDVHAEEGENWSFELIPLGLHKRLSGRDWGRGGAHPSEGKSFNKYWEPLFAHSDWVIDA